MLSHVQLFATPWTVACQAPLSMEFSRQEYWSGSHFPLQGIFPTQGSNPSFLHCRQILYCLSCLGSPNYQNLSLFITSKTTSAQHKTDLRLTYRRKETDFKYSRFDAGYWMLGAGALGRPRGMVWGGRREEGSGWGTHVYLWWIHFDVWQN